MKSFAQSYMHKRNTENSRLYITGNSDQIHHSTTKRNLTNITK